MDHVHNLMSEAMLESTPSSVHSSKEGNSNIFDTYICSNWEALACHRGGFESKIQGMIVKKV